MINQVLRFCEIVEFDGDGSIVKTKPVLKESTKEDLFKSKDVLDFFSPFS